MSTTRLPDDVWTGLRPSAVRLPKRSRWLLAVALTGVAVATVLIAFGVASGQLGGSLRTPTWDISIDTSAHTFTESISIRNEAWFDETVDGLGFASRDLQVAEVDRAFHDPARPGSNRARRRPGTRLRDGPGR